MNGIGVSGGDGLKFWHQLALVIAAGFLLGRLGPFATFSELPPAERYAYWIGLLVLTWLQILASAHLLRSVLARRAWIIQAVAAAVVGSIPAAFEVAWAESLLRVERDLGLVDVIQIYGDVLLIAVPLTLILALLERRRPTVAAAPAGLPPGAGADELLAQVPPDRRGALIALSAEDHYLRIHTERGDTLIHHRFADALDRVASLDGLRVHRSWWVARSAIEAIEKEGDRHVLRLANGLRVPVSRTYLLAVREAGLAPA